PGREGPAFPASAAPSARRAPRRRPAGASACPPGWPPAAVAPRAPPPRGAPTGRPRRRFAPAPRAAGPSRAAGLRCGCVTRLVFLQLHGPAGTTGSWSHGFRQGLALVLRTLFGGVFRRTAVPCTGLVVGTRGSQISLNETSSSSEWRK